MTFLPVVVRELIVKARQPSTYRTRAGTAAIMVAMFVLVLFISNGVSQRVVGQRLLNACGMLALAFTMISGLFLTADCISSEKRDGTIGLLFLTDLKPYDVLFGKLAGSCLNAVFGLLAVFPVLALPILVGGVTGSEFARLLLAFAVVAFFSLSIGLLASVVSREAKDALARAIAAMFVFSVLMPALWWLIALATQKGTMGMPADNAFNFLLWPCPVYTYLKAFAASYATRSGWIAYWSSVLMLVGISIASLVSATLLLPRVWHSETATPLSKLRDCLKIFAGKGARSTRSIDGTNPIFSLCMHDTRTRRHVRTALVILLPIWIGFLVLSVTRNTGNEPLFCGAFFTAFAAHLVTKTFIALEASRRFAEDRQSGAMELLLVTPIEIKEMLKGQLAAVKRQFRGVLVVLCAMNAVMMFCVVYFSKRLHTENDEAMTGFGVVFFGGIFALMLDFPALAWLAMWRAIASRKHHYAVMITILQVLAPGWLLIFFFVIAESRFAHHGPTFVFGIWFTAGALVSIINIALSRKNVTTRFRTIAVASTR
jgi:ABC-type transport system involved in multi-copper enzyme maturation permease subunit